MSKVDISSEAVERLAAHISKTCGCAIGPNAEQPVAATLRAQAERIKELEHFLAQEKKIAEKDHGVWCDNYAALDRRYKTARNDALLEALSHKWLCFHKCDEEIEVVNAEDIIALIEGATND